MTIDEAIHLLTTDAEFDDVWIEEKQGREIGALLRSMEARLNAAEALAKRSETCLRISNRMINGSLGYMAKGYIEFEDINAILDIGLQEFRAAGKESDDE